jgi:antirestriction protein ArdC
MLKNSGADIRHGGGKAFYRPSEDYIQMPPKECFVDEPHYYSTALHELTHWTGAEKRLRRDLTRISHKEVAKSRAIECYLHALL